MRRNDDNSNANFGMHNHDFVQRTSIYLHIYIQSNIPTNFVSLEWEKAQPWSFAPVNAKPERFLRTVIFASQIFSRFL